MSGWRIYVSHSFCCSSDLLKQVVGSLKTSVPFSFSWQVLLLIPAKPPLAALSQRSSEWLWHTAWRGRRNQDTWTVWRDDFSGDSFYALEIRSINRPVIVISSCWRPVVVATVIGKLENRRLSHKCDMTLLDGTGARGCWSLRCDWR